MNCRLCDNELVIYKKTYNSFLVCENCYQHFEPVDTKQCCDTPDKHFVKHKISNGDIVIREQCNNCGKILGRSFPKSTVDINTLKFSDTEKNEQYENVTSKDTRELFEFVKINQKEKFFDKYELYLKGQEWKEKQKLVFERDKNICQSCLVSKADHVHHLTYKHLYNEPLFDLVAICTKCHDIVTKIDRKENVKEKISHKKASR